MQRTNISESPVPHGRIARRLIMAIVLFSSLITLGTTGLQLYSDYKKDIERINTDFKQISETALPSLRESVWVSNDDRIMTQLEGLLRMPDMEYVGIRVNDKVRWEVGSHQSKKAVSTELPLVHAYRGEAVVIGFLNATASLDNVYRRIWDRVFVILASNALKTFLVAGFIFFLFQKWVTRYLDKIADYVSQLRLDPMTEPLYLERRDVLGHTHDELDLVVSAINRMRTNLTQAYEDRKNSEARYRELFENSPAPLWELDLSEVKSRLEDKPWSVTGDTSAREAPLAEGVKPYLKRLRVVEINASAMKLFETDDLEQIRERLFDCLSAFSGRVFEQILDSLRGNMISGVITARVKTLRENPIDLLLRWELLPGYEEDWSRILISATDLTTLKKIEEQRREMDLHAHEKQRLESLGLLAGGIAHDFNNLLVGILGNADLALSELPASTKGRAFIQQVKSAAGRAADLTRQLLAYSGQGKFIVEPIELNPLVEEMVRLLRAALAKGASLELHLGKDLPMIEADSTQIRQVIMNLVMNASDALDGKSGRIRIKTGLINVNETDLSDAVPVKSPPDGKYVFVEVTDTGMGMDPETVQKIFDPFFTTKFSGRGLGLAAVLGIVRGHGGAIRVSSNPGWGTTMTLLFPPSSRPARRVISPARVSKPWKGTGTILVVDDDETAREVTREMLNRAGFRVISHGNGLDAIDTYRKRWQEITFVLLDMTMPYMDGWATFGELRRIDPKVRVIMVSGYSEQETVNRAQEGGIRGFIQKPFSKDELLSKIREVFEQREE